MKLGDIVYIWRGQNHKDKFNRGIIAKAILVEGPVNISEVKYPHNIRNDLWLNPDSVNNNEMKAGLKILESRLTLESGMISIEKFKNEAVLSKLQIVVAPRPTNYLINNVAASEKIDELWNACNEIIEENLFYNDEIGIKGLTDIDGTLRLQITRARKGQIKFKKNLQQNEKGCRVTGLTDVDFLIASHIKPWRNCSTDEEKLHGCNGLLLAPHIDLLFDEGYISFNDEGDMLVSDFLNKQVFTHWSINPDKNVGKFNSQQKVFLKYHRDYIFNKKFLKRKNIIQNQ